MLPVYKYTVLARQPASPSGLWSKCYARSLRRMPVSELFGLSLLRQRNIGLKDS